ncbi:2-oxoglutarate (2OG) and Fe(II)-dependent oxygenase superfamily protein [Rhynchospora pubera]|uniref:2-oxoglutarate (2OG) and Fe(II)-dependent oxygenase superfamily protein n=1 Tax=Rhynchospora pubera TaxID=906938 RepID=A0AAV8DW29_9POAL|nr:2-oxoglutarate (2OG) and Fe(II)-dependent oxygenase superfamily protein [Rhynchospora pubera]
MFRRVRLVFPVFALLFPWIVKLSTAIKFRSTGIINILVVITEIPSKYIKPPIDRPSLDSFHNSETDLYIPVIDISPLINGSDRTDEAMHAISHACKEWGFFQVVNHGVAPDLVQKLRAAWREFFYSPMEAKKAYANDPKTYEGYGSRVGVDKEAILDWGDYFFLYLLPESTKNLNKWPELPPNLREITEEYGEKVMKLSKMLIKAISTSLGLDENYMLRAFGGDNIAGTLRVNYYPKCPQPELTLGLSPHSDPGLITVLLADEHVKGCQVKKGDLWVDIKPKTGAFIVNIADQIQVLTNAIYKSVEHRVLANAESERFSFAFFCNPKGDMAIGSAPELVSPLSKPLYEPITFNEYRLYVRNKGPLGKSQVESLKAA